MTSRPVEGVRIRYFWRVLIVGHAMQAADARTGRSRAAPPARRIGRRRSARTRPSTAPPAERLDRVPPASMVRVAGTHRHAHRRRAADRGRLGGCAVKHPTAQPGQRASSCSSTKCGSCHTLAHANTTGHGRAEPRRRVPPGPGRRRQEHLDRGPDRLLDPVPEHAGRDAGEAGQGPGRPGRGGVRRGRGRRARAGHRRAGDRGAAGHAEAGGRAERRRLQIDADPTRAAEQFAGLERERHRRTRSRCG